MDETTTSRYAGRPLAELTATLGQLHGVHNAVLAEMLQITAEVARQEGHVHDGCRDEAAWLQQRLGVSRQTAKRWADTGAALESLPVLRQAFASGELSFDKAAAAAKIADRDCDEVVTKEAKDLSVAALESAGRKLREITPEEDAAIRRRRSFGVRWQDGGTWASWWGGGPAEDAARVMAALDRRAKQLPVTDENGELVSLAARRADALSELAGVQIANDQDPDRATVVLSFGIDELGSGKGAVTQQGGVLSSPGLQRLLCDARIQAVLEDVNGHALGAGLMTRNISASLRRKLKERDGTCRMPGCDNEVFLEGHHLELWPTRPTDDDHVALFCRHHHKLFHEGRWRIEGNPNGHLTFIRPDGSVLHDGPPPLDYDVKKWLWEDLVPAGGP